MIANDQSSKTSKCIDRNHLLVELKAKLQGKFNQIQSVKIMREYVSKASKIQSYSIKFNQFNYCAKV